MMLNRCLLKMWRKLANLVQNRFTVYMYRSKIDAFESLEKL